MRLVNLIRSQLEMQVRRTLPASLLVDLPVEMNYRILFIKGYLALLTIQGRFEIGLEVHIGGKYIIQLQIPLHARLNSSAILPWGKSCFLPRNWNNSALM